STASNKGDVASVGRMARALGAVSLNRLRISVEVEKAIAKSPLPLLYDEPVRASPNTARAASRPRSRASSGASVATTSMHDPSADARASRSAAPFAAERRLGGCSALKIETPPIVRLPPKFVCARTPTVYSGRRSAARDASRREAVPIPPFHP